jgi:hypothetical protein
VDRELVLAVLMCALAGGASWLGGVGVALVGWLGERCSRLTPRRLPSAGVTGASTPVSGVRAAPTPSPVHGLADEQVAWRQLWLPLWPGLLALSFLLGWALQEPDGAEPLHVLAFAVALPFAALWLRAAVRAWRSARAAARARPLISTRGLWRPQVVVAPQLRDALDAAALRAALEHEAAHLRHGDPLRLWLAQIATDLQGSTVAARRRLERWRTALELARDDEACARGIDGGDLAAALLATARLGQRAGALPAIAAPALAELATSPSAQAFRERVTRLLQRESPPPPPPPRSALRWLAPLLLSSALLGALGLAHGELLVSSFALPGS